MIYPFNHDKRISSHFILGEFSCRREYKPCYFCGGSIREEDLPIIWETAGKLEHLRASLNSKNGNEIEIILSDATRCYIRNAVVTSCKPPELSRHFSGFAIDIIARNVKTKNYISYDVLAGACLEHFKKEQILVEFNHVHITIL